MESTPVASREYPPRPLVGIGVVVLRADAVLLIRRGRAPALGSWSFPGGAQRLGETAEDAARRELAEETGLIAGPLVLAGHADRIERDEAGRIRFHYTILDFATRDPGGIAQAAADASALAWVRFDELGAYGLPDDMQRIAANARRLLESTPTAPS